MDEQKPAWPGAESGTAGVTQVGTLELREEVLMIAKERVQTGQVTFRREVQTRTETVQVELRRETLVISVHPGEGAVFFGDDPMQPGETKEVVLYDERAVVDKQPYVTEEVRIGKQTVTERQQQQIDLQYEVLVVNREGVETRLDPRSAEHPAGPQGSS